MVYNETDKSFVKGTEAPKRILITTDGPKVQSMAMNDSLGENRQQGLGNAVERPLEAVMDVSDLNYEIKKKVKVVEGDEARRSGKVSLSEKQDR